jgi:hypothetical protein
LAQRKHGIRASFGALALALAAAAPSAFATQTLGPVDPVDPRFKALSEHMAQQTALRCNPAFDGDASKGELTNKDVASLMSSNLIKKALPDFPDARVGGNLAEAASQGFAVCVDKNMKGLTDSNGKPITAMIHFAQGDFGDAAKNISIIAISPLAPNPADARTSAQMAIVDAAEHIGAITNKAAMLMMMMQSGDPRAKPFLQALLFKPVGVSFDPAKYDDSEHLVGDPKLVGMASPGKGPEEVPAAKAPAPRGPASGTNGGNLTPTTAPRSRYALEA